MDFLFRFVHKHVFVNFRTRWTYLFFFCITDYIFPSLMNKIGFSLASECFSAKTLPLSYLQRVSPRGSPRRKLKQSEEDETPSPAKRSFQIPLTLRMTASHNSFRALLLFFLCLCLFVAHNLRQSLNNPLARKG